MLWSLAWYPLSLMVELGLGVGWSGFPSSSATVVAPRETYPLTGGSLPLFLPGIPSSSPMPGHRRLPAVGLGGLAQESSAGLLTSSADESALWFHAPCCPDGLASTLTCCSPLRHLLTPSGFPLKEADLPDTLHLLCSRAFTGAQLL